MGGTKEYRYVLNDAGYKVLDEESSLQRMKDYLEAGGLYPFEIRTLKDRSTIGKALESNMSSLEEPAIILWNKDAKKTVFGLLLFMINRNGKYRKNYMSYTRVPLGHLLQQHLMGDYIDISEEFINYDILFITIGEDDFPNMLNAYCIKNIANSRKEKGKYTFFYYQGNKQMLQQKYTIDELGEGKRSVIYTEDKVIDKRILTPITNYIKTIDLNVLEGKK